MIIGIVALATTAVGCVPEGVCDPDTLSKARSLVVLPGVGAPGLDGKGAGAMQGGLLITSLADLQYFDRIEGPARLRQSVRAAGNEVWDPALQGRLAEQLDIDLFVLTDVLDYRFVKEYHSAHYYVGSSHWSETAHHVVTTLRFVRPKDGKLVFYGSGQGVSKEGYGPAVIAANEMALRNLKQFLQQEKSRQAERARREAQRKK